MTGLNPADDDLARRPKYHAWRAIGHDAMGSIRQGAPESGASMMLEMMGQQAIEELGDLRPRVYRQATPSEP